MDALLRQTRVRFSGLGQETTIKEVTNSNRERRIPPQKTQSFKGEKKRSQNWFSRQFSRDMSQDDYDGDDDHEYAMAVAATAFAISSSIKELTINNTDDQRKPRERPQQDSITRTSQPANKVSRQKSGDFSRSDTKEPTRNVGQSPSLKKSPTFQDKKSPVVQSPKYESENIKLNSPFSKQLTFPDKNNPASANPLPTKQPTFRATGSIKANAEETEADKWEKAEMIKIKEKYASMKNTILDWENKKKGKAKNKKERNEQSELEKKRSKAMQKYREEIDRIEKIAGGAKAKADENERYEKAKVKNKANKFRETGKRPPTCFCF
ncbi:uncharacterized protein At3g61260-like [Impatiens glandulifera]|uniref:uncharacterized protein At3g61260-like n=1 Tax=Impatiens glandulifera TaxID=253017 RepID=UPI001FB16627|nr:uncharacterized protein At3g61260-like [Impatiens glandulifera]